MTKGSILRWSGSKAKLVPDLLQRSPPKFERYIEPFAGSACLYFAIKPRQGILGDINSEVANVYRAIKADPDSLADTLDTIPKTAEAYYLLRAANPVNLTSIQRAARLIFLMKACFNGVYRTNKNGGFNVPIGNRVYALPDRCQLRAAQKLLATTRIVNGDFATTLSLSRPGDWIYLDPPYRAPGRYRGEYGYAAEFDENNLQQLISLAKELAANGRHVTISYVYDESLLTALPGWTAHTVKAARTVAGRTSVRQTVPELLLTSYTST